MPMEYLLCKSGIITEIDLGGYVYMGIRIRDYFGTQVRGKVC